MDELPYDAGSKIAMLEMAVTNLTNQLEAQRKTVMELQTGHLQLAAIIKNHARFLRDGDPGWDILKPEAGENLDKHIRDVIRQHIYVSVTVDT